MWLLTRHGFISAVEFRDDPSCISVRARRLDHLEDVLQFAPDPAAEIIVTPHADYRYRTILPRGEFEQLVMALAEDVLYDNFKAAVPKGKYAVTKKAKGKLEDIWHLLGDLQPKGPYGWRRARRREVPAREKKLRHFGRRWSRSLF